MKKIFASVVLFLALSCAVPASACDGHYEDQWRNIVLRSAYTEQVWDGYQYVQYYHPAVTERRLIRVWCPEYRGHGGFTISWNWHAW